MNEVRNERNELSSSAMLAGQVQAAEELGSIRVDRMLGFQKMPNGYALMLDADRMYFRWLCWDGTESQIDWNKWRVRRGAIRHSANTEVTHRVPTNKAMNTQKKSDTVESTALFALKPFADYYERITDGRRGYPTTGTLYALDSGCDTEVEITIEDLKRAYEIFHANSPVQSQAKNERS